MARHSLSDTPLVRTTTAGQAADRLRLKILNGELRPGTPLREIPISRSLGISRNTFREALHQLAHEGLVRHALHRGASVVSLSEADIRSIFLARRVLELAAADTLKGRHREAAQALATAAARLDDAIRRRDPAAVAEEDMAFHSALVDQIASDRLSAHHRALVRELRIGLLLVDRRRPDFAALGREHRALVRLIARGELARFRQRLAAHLQGSEQQLLELASRTRPAVS